MSSWGAAGVQLRFESSGDASPRLTADVRRHVFLIFKEILNNVVRHADARTVQHRGHRRGTTAARRR